MYNILIVVLKKTMGHVCAGKATQAMGHIALVSTLYSMSTSSIISLVVIDTCTNNGGCDPVASCESDPTAPGGRTCMCPPEQYTGDGIVCLRMYPNVINNKIIMTYSIGSLHCCRQWGL